MGEATGSVLLLVSTIIFVSSAKGKFESHMKCVRDMMKTYWRILLCFGSTGDAVINTPRHLSVRLQRTMDLRCVGGIHVVRIENVTDDKVIDADAYPTIVVPDSGCPQIAIYKDILTAGILSAAPRLGKLGFPKFHLSV